MTDLFLPFFFFSLCQRFKTADPFVPFPLFTAFSLVSCFTHSFSPLFLSLLGWALAGMPSLWFFFPYPGLACFFFSSHNNTSWEGALTPPPGRVSFSFPSPTKVMTHFFSKAHCFPFPFSLFGPRAQLGPVLAGHSLAIASNPPLFLFLWLCTPLFFWGFQPLSFRFLFLSQRGFYGLRLSREPHLPLLSPFFSGRTNIFSFSRQFRPSFSLVLFR